MRHLCRQQACRVRGLPQRNHSFGGPRTPSAAHGSGHARLRGALVVRCSRRRRITFMATHANAAAHRASRSPLVINISRLGRRPGSMLTVQETVPAPTRIGLDLIAIEQGAPLELNLRIESVSEGALVTGTVSAPTSGE